MSIYDELSPDDQPDRPDDESEQLLWAEPADEPEAESTAESTPAQKRSRGCGSCLGGCAVVAFVSLVLLVAAGLFVWRQLPNWTHGSLVAVVQESDLPAEEKLAVVRQLDRVRDGYRSGDLTLGHLAYLAEQLADSPVYPWALMHAAEESYVAPSGLSAEEKQAARMVLQRIARGLHEEKIDQTSLDPALDYVSTKGYDGQRHFSRQVSDADLRELLSTWAQLADRAGVPAGPFEVDLSGELELAIDRSLDKQL